MCFQALSRCTTKPAARLTSFTREEAVGESVDDIHRGESGDEPTVLLITYAGTPGVPTSIPAKGEKAEY